METPLQPTDAGEPSEAIPARRPVAFVRSIPFLIGVWFSFLVPLLGAPICVLVAGELPDLSWAMNLGVANSICLVLVVLLLALVWAVLAAWLAMLTREWAARRRYFRS